MAQKFLARVSGQTRQVEANQTSAGASDAGKIPALDAAGKLDSSLMPNGVGANTNPMPASENLTNGSFVNIWSDSGTAKVRLADNSNGREADGYVLANVTTGNNATVYPLDGVNSGLSGLTPGTKYYLGTAGGVTATPLDETSAGNANKVSQFLGKAKSATELITTDDPAVVL